MFALPQRQNRLDQALWRDAALAEVCQAFQGDRPHQQRQRSNHYDADTAACQLVYKVDFLRHRWGREEQKQQASEGDGIFHEESGALKGNQSGGAGFTRSSESPRRGHGRDELNQLLLG